MIKNWILWPSCGLAAGLLISCGGDDTDNGGPAAAEPPKTATPAAIEGMVWIPGGKFMMGSYSGMPHEAPTHQVELDGFFMDETEVTNAQFRAFVDATGFLTAAEQPMPEELLQYLPPELRREEQCAVWSHDLRQDRRPRSAESTRMVVDRALRQLASAARPGVVD